MWNEITSKMYIEKRRRNDSHFQNIKNLSIRDTKAIMIFCLSKTHQKKHVEVASVFRPSKLYQKITSK